MEKVTETIKQGSTPARLWEMAKLFFRIGATAFGGPASLIAMMYDETVLRRNWLTDQEFLDMIGATNLIPGSNSTEMAIHLGYKRAGRWGMLVGGVSFFLPAFLVVLALGWAYVRFEKIPEVGLLLYGIKPVVVAVIFKALLGLGQKAINGKLLAVIAAGVLGLYFVGVNEILLLFAGALLYMLISNIQAVQKTVAGALFLAPFAGLKALSVSTAAASVPFSLQLLFLTFLKIGAVLYGSGYVLLAFLRADFVVRLGWLTEQQLLDAIAIGQLNPGPFFSTATFIGYFLSGYPGAVIATVGILLPSFIISMLTSPLIPRIRDSKWVGSFMDGINAASIGLMAAVTWQIGRASLIDPFTIILALAAAVALFRFKVNSTLLVLGGAAAGLISMFFR
jgi:chromate transporter